jgi:hypothetical protein
MSGVSGGQAFDLKSDWSDGFNPNTAGWAFREGTNLLPHVSSWSPAGFTVPQPAWAPSGSDPTFLPAWFKYNGTYIDPLDFLPGDVVTHSNTNGLSPSNATWTSPVAGNFRISGSLWNGRNIGRSNSWVLTLGNSVIASGSLVSGDGNTRATPATFSANAQINIGDVLKLQITATSLPGDFVGVNLQIAQPRYNVCLLYDPTKAVKAGSTVPIKLELCDRNGNHLSSPSITLHALSVTQTSTSISGVFEDAGNANPDDNFRFDSSLGAAGGYIINLKTTGLTTGTYSLNFTVTDDTFVYTAPFQVK